MKAKAALGCDV